MFSELSSAFREIDEWGGGGDGMTVGLQNEPTARLPHPFLMRWMSFIGVVFVPLAGLSCFQHFNV